MRAAGTQSRTNRKHIGGAIVFHSLTFAVSFACVLLLHNLPFSWMCVEPTLPTTPRCRDWWS